MHRQAIDIVILPSGNLLDLSFELNKRAFESGNAVELLRKDDFMPHLSILMGVVEHDKLPKLIKQLEKNIPKDIQIQLKLSANQDNWMHFEKTDSLMELHKSLYREIDPMVQHSAEDEDFYRHITVGTPPNTEDIPLPQYFTESHIALCALGRYNTCRKILWSTQNKTSL